MRREEQMNGMLVSELTIGDHRDGRHHHVRPREMRANFLMAGIGALIGDLCCGPVQ